MAIQIQQEQMGTLRILGLSGRLDTETAVDVELALQDLLAAGERHFLVDLGGIGYVSSAGLRVLLGLAKQLDGGKGTLKLCGLNPTVKQVFEVAGFSKLFTIMPDRAAALKMLPPSMTQSFKAALPPSPKQELNLGQRAAMLIGASTKAAAPHPQAADIARAAAELLGLKPMPAPAAAAPVAAPAAAPRSAPAPKGAPVARAAPTARADSAEEPGFLGKLRGLFRGKK